MKYQGSIELTISIQKSQVGLSALWISLNSKQNLVAWPSHWAWRIMTN